MEDPGEHQGGADAGRLGGPGLSLQGRQRPGLRPGVAGLQQGQGRLPHRRDLAAGRPAEGHGRRRRLHAAPRPER